MSPITAINSTLKEYSHLTGVSSILGLLLFVLFETKTIVKYEDFAELKEKVEILVSSNNNSDRSISDLKVAIEQLSRLVCSTIKDTTIKASNGSCQ